MKADDTGHIARSTVPKVAMDCVTHHLAQFFRRFRLCSDGVPESRGDITAIGFIFPDFKNDFAHKAKATLELWAGQGLASREVSQ